MKNAIVFVAAMAAAAAFCGDVWEDAAVLLFSNFTCAEGQTVGNGVWVNDRNTSKTIDGSYRPDASKPLPDADRDEIKKMYTVTNEDVRILGEGGVTYVNEPCLHFEPYLNPTGCYQSTFFTFPGCKKGINGDKTKRSEFDFANDSFYTICMRFKPGLCTPSSGFTDRKLLEMGPGNGWDGVQIYYKVAADGTYGYIYALQSAQCLSVGSYGGSGDCELMVTNGVWADIAVICASNRIDVGVRHEKLFRAADRGLEYSKTQGGRRFTWKSGTFDPVAVNRSLVPPYDYNRLNNSYSWNATTEADNRAISGSLHRYGFWTRALNRDEVYEYFSEAKRPNLLKVGPGGTEQAGAKMFRGTSGTAVTVNNRPGEWHNLPPEVSKGVASTVSFTVDEAYAGLPQVLKLTAGSGTGYASGTVLVKLDGVALATLDVAAGGKAMELIDGAKFTAGTHTLSYERADDGSGALILNAIELKGSWQAGKDDNIYSQTATRDDFTSSHIFSFVTYNYNPASAANGWLCDFPASPRNAFYGTSEEIYNTRLSFPVDPDLIAARYRFRYEMKIAKIYFQYNTGSKWKYTMKFNDSYEKSFTQDDYVDGDIVKVPTDDFIRGGSNTNLMSIKVTDPGTQVNGLFNNQVYADYYRMRILPPLSGTLITIR